MSYTKIIFDGKNLHIYNGGEIENIHIHNDITRETYKPHVDDKYVTFNSDKYKGEYCNFYNPSVCPADLKAHAVDLLIKVKRDNAKYNRESFRKLDEAMREENDLQRIVDIQFYNDNDYIDETYYENLKLVDELCRGIEI